MKESVIVAAKRTPIGSFQGQLSKFSSPTLAATLIRAIIKELGLKNNQIDEVILGNVLTAGLGQAPARQAAILAGCDQSIEALTINKMCGSGLKAVMLADQSIRCGDANAILSGGMESMSNSPYLLTKARSGLKLGHGKVIDSVINDGLWDAYNNMHMGNCAELLVSERNYGREEQDDYATRSYTKSLKAQSEGIFESEIIPMIKKDKKNNIIEIAEDEEPKKVIFDKINKLKPVFDIDGTITAANASTLNDGASVLLVMSQTRAKELGLNPLAKIISHASYAHDPKWFTTAPSQVIKKVLKKSSMDKKDVGLWEINEAFSIVAMAAIDDFNLDAEKVNIYGGAVALGHPIGASGARILTTLLNGMNKRNVDVGLATLCIGGGEASAIIVEKI
ncbi:thiolase family protein [Candidatus Marinimicrobia bacterium]|nr:thiolase family protein [Candidatus Neomarinimicrobiota bacterium]